MTTDITAPPSNTEPAVNDPFALIAQAVTSGNVPVDVVEQLVALQRTMAADRAREAFVRAMTQFQAQCPIVSKRKPVTDRFGRETYRYAPIESIAAAALPHLQQNGLSYRFDTETLPGEKRTIAVRDRDGKDTPVEVDGSVLVVRCIVSHVDGHSETSTFKVMLGSERFMTDQQKTGARDTYAKRRALCNALGIVTGDEDKDGAEGGGKGGSLAEDAHDKFKDRIAKASDEGVLKGVVAEAQEAARRAGDFDAYEFFRSVGIGRMRALREGGNGTE